MIFFLFQRRTDFENHIHLDWWNDTFCLRRKCTSVLHGPNQPFGVFSSRGPNAKHSHLSRSLDQRVSSGLQNFLLRLSIHHSTLFCGKYFTLSLFIGNLDRLNVCFLSRGSRRNKITEYYVVKY